MKLSNNTLSVLLGVAILTSILGTFFSINFLDDLITGAATTTGNVTLTVSSTANCEATDNIIAFGNLAQNATNDSDGANNDTIIITNTGNVNLNITEYASVELFSSQSAPSIYWRIRCYGNESGGCNTTWHNVEDSGSPSLLIDDLDFTDGSDDFNISVNVTVPDNEGTGAKNGEITFTCTAA